VSKWGLFFTKPGMKTNRQYCWDTLLSQQILDTMKHVTHILMAILSFCKMMHWCLLHSTQSNWY